MQADGGVCGGVAGDQARGRAAARIDEERVLREAGIPATALGVEDPQLGPATRRSEPVPADEHLGPLPDHVPAEPDPRAPGKLQAERRGRGDRGRQLPPEARRLEDDEQDAGPPGERRESFEAVAQAGLPFGWMAGCPPGGPPQPAGGPPRASAGRSITRTSTDRPASSEPAIAMPSSGVSGWRTTSHSSRTPRATASTGSRLRARSTQAAIAPPAWASATSRRATVVWPLEGRSAQGNRRITGHAARTEDRVEGGEAGPDHPLGVGSSDRPSSSGSAISSGAMASAPITRGAAAPQRVRRDARAAETSGERLAMGHR